MIVRVRLFALARERFGAAEAEREVPDDTTVADLWRSLCEERPQLQPLTSSVSFAVNREYVDRSQPLRDGDEVAMIPPVSGGCG